MKNLLFLLSLLAGGFACAQPCGMSMTVLSTFSGSCGQCDGSITVSASNGTPPYAYTWSNSQADSVATNLCGGTYACTVVDDSGCVATGTFTITQSPAVTVSLTTTNPSCPTCCDGSALATVTSGTPSYAYAWSDGMTTALDTGLCEGKYFVCVTDTNGCMSCDTIDLAADSAWGIGENLRGERLAVFPNPVQDELKLQLPDGIRGNVVMEVYNVMGETVSRSEWFMQDETLSFNAGPFPPGIYWLRLKLGQSCYSATFVHE